MKLINSSAEVISQGTTFNDILEHIELCGRTCYKSKGTRYFTTNKDNISEKLLNDEKLTVNFDPFLESVAYVSIPDILINKYPEVLGDGWIEEEKEYSSYYQNKTAKDFVSMILNNNHLSVLEHGTIYLTISINNPEFKHKLKYYDKNPYSKIICDGQNLYITTNFRVIAENDLFEDLKFLTEPSEKHELRTSVKFICDRGVSHELVRHRVFSFSQESTRYCNYSKNKFGAEVTFVLPTWFEKEEDPYIKDFFLGTLRISEHAYFELLNGDKKPEEARQVLPNALKTEIIMTGFNSDWVEFINLRSSEKAHPDMRKLVNDLELELTTI